MQKQPEQQVQKQPEQQVQKQPEQTIDENINQDTIQQITDNGELANYSDISGISNSSNILSEEVIEKICSIPKPTFYFIITSLVIGYVLYTFTSPKISENKKN